ncbi:MAG: hypothetical protein U1E36_05640 [Rickettsiales bacterium]
MVLSWIPLTDRAVVDITGEDAASFLQGLITNDIEKATPEQTIFAALLAPQGKFLFDFFIAKKADGYLLDTEAPRADELIKKLGMYKLRAKVNIARSDKKVVALLNESAHTTMGLSDKAGDTKTLGDSIVYADPRWLPMGVRMITPAYATQDILPVPTLEAGLENYERIRLLHGIPEGSKDAIIDRTIVLETGYDELNGIDYKKGCYVGQEVIARTTHRGVVRKKLFCISADQNLPPLGTEIIAGDIPLGEMRSSCGHVGLGVIRIEEWQLAMNTGHVPTAGGVPLVITFPEWHI